MSTVHIVGIPILIGREARQRCSWCGELLFEVTGHEMAPMKADGSPPDPMRPWEPGSLLEVTKTQVCTGYSVVPHVDGDQLPANSCVGPPKLRSIRGGAT